MKVFALLVCLFIFGFGFVVGGSIAYTFVYRVSNPNFKANPAPSSVPQTDSMAIGFSKPKFPQCRKYVTDAAGIWDVETEQRLNQVGYDIEHDKGYETAFVSVKEIPDGGLKSYSNDLFRECGVGHAGIDNGLMVVVLAAPGKAMSEWKVFVATGYRTEIAIPDGRAGDAYRAIKAGFSENNIPKGMIDGAVILQNYLHQFGEVFLYTGQPPSTGGATAAFLIVGFISGLLLLGFVILIAKGSGSSSSSSDGSYYSSSSSSSSGSSSSSSSYGGGSSGGGGAGDD